MREGGVKEVEERTCQQTEERKCDRGINQRGGKTQKITLILCIQSDMAGVQVHNLPAERLHCNDTEWE